MIGRPSNVELTCPKCNSYDTFKAIYARFKNRYVKIGRKCIDSFVADYWSGEKNKGCGHFASEH